MAGERAISGLLPFSSGKFAFCAVIWYNGVSGKEGIALRDEEAMLLALAEARAAAEAGEVPVGAVLVRGDEVIARARNRRETDQDPTAHAELLALREGARALHSRRLSGCTLYVTLEPCPMCAGALAMAQLERCVWGAADPRCGCCGSVYDLPADPALGGGCTWRGGVLRGDCEEVLRDFFRRKRGG